MKTFSLMLGVLVLSTTVTAIAETGESGFYVGIGGGDSDFDVKRDQVLAGALAIENGAVISFPMTTVPPLVRRGGARTTPFVNRMLDRTDSTLSFTVGYTFNRYFSAEVAYTDLGEVTSQHVANLPLISSMFTSAVVADQKVEIDTISLTALATLPVTSRFQIFARAGFTVSQADSDLRLTLLQAPVGLSVDPSMPFGVSARSRRRDDFDSEGVAIGVGASFDVFKRFTLRADFTNFMRMGEGGFTRSVDADTTSLTAIYRF